MSATYTVFVLTEPEDKNTFHFVGITSQPPFKRLCDLVSATKLKKNGKSMLTFWIEDLVKVGAVPHMIEVEAYSDQQVARNKMTELVNTYINTQHPIKNSFKGGFLRVNQGRPLKEKVNANS